MKTLHACGIPDCSRTLYARGWCQAHYARWLRYGDPLGLAPTKPVRQVQQCVADGCKKLERVRGLCTTHYSRWLRYGSLEAQRTPPGEGLRFIKAVALAHDSDACLRWPYGVTRDGYGRVRYEGRQIGAHRLACIMAHGPQPSRLHEAAHSCGNATCVNPRHLRWATPVENTSDKYQHGTIRLGERHSLTRLKEADVIEIHRLRGQLTLRQIAARFGVSPATIGMIHTGRNWGWLSAP